MSKVGRNDPCYCGSGRKYKKCHGSAGEPEKKVEPSKESNGEKMDLSQLDPKKMDMKTMWKLSRMLKKLPKDQLNRMQSLAQQAMKGKDVSKEMAALQNQLPPEFLDAVQAQGKKAETAEEKKPGKIKKMFKGLMGKSS